MCDYESLERNIRVLSDLHLEHYENLPDFNTFITPNRKDILCLCGDIGNPFQASYKSFLAWCKSNFGIVLVVTGNHEYYGSSILDTDIQIQNICNELGIFFLNNRVFIHSNYAFIGTTLWSYVPPDKIDFVKERMNDYHLIKNFNPDESNKLFFKNVKYLEDTINLLKSQNYRVIVLSHHTPSTNNTSFAPYESQPGNCAFSTDLPDFIKAVDIWIYGHTHYNNADNVFYKWNTPLISNQRGYPGSLVKGYDPAFKWSL